MPASKDPEDSTHKDKQDRSVHIGHAVNVQVISGDNAEVTTVIDGQQVVITTQDVVEALRKVKGILAAAEVDSTKQKEIQAAVSEAEAEMAKDKPEKGRIGQALEKAVTLAKGATNAKELIALAGPVLSKAAAWLGDAGAGLLTMLK